MESTTWNPCKKIGVGVTTTPKRKVDQRLFNYTSSDTTIVVKTDTEQLGASSMRNALLFDLSDCDYIFLFDDDCWPMMPGWEAYFISQSIEHGVDYMSLPEAFKSNLIQVDGEMGRWDGGVGCFNFQTRHALETIGGYNTKYVRYGYEDAARNRRATLAGLTGGHVNSCPIRALAYIHSMDVFGENPTPNLSYAEKMEFIYQNTYEFQKESSGDQLFYPFK